MRNRGADCSIWIPILFFRGGEGGGESSLWRCSSEQIFILLMICCSLQFPLIFCDKMCVLGFHYFSVLFYFRFRSNFRLFITFNYFSIWGWYHSTIDFCFIRFLINIWFSRFPIDLFYFIQCEAWGKGLFFFLFFGLVPLALERISLNIESNKSVAISILHKTTIVPKYKCFNKEDIVVSMVYIYVKYFHI